MKSIRKLNKKNIWNYELGYWWFSDISRFGKVVAHIELYKRIVNLPGTIAEFGIYKASSFIRWLSLREIFETTNTRKIIGFDNFGSFPKKNLLKVNSDINFIKKFEKDGGSGLSLLEVKSILKSKYFSNFELIKGDIRNTLPKYLNRNNSERFSMIHLDLDVYEPTNYTLKKLYDRLVKGGLIIIDDYNTVEGATIAIDEFVKKYPKLKIEKLTYNNTPSFIIKS